MTTRVSKEPERPRRFHRQSGWGDRNRQLPGPRWDAHDRGEQTTGDTVVSAREDIERVETDGGESERPIVSLKRGNHPVGPCGEKGTPCHDTVGGTHGGCIETHNPVHEPTTVAASGTRRSADSLREPSRSEFMIWRAVCPRGHVRIRGSPRGAIPWGHPACVRKALGRRKRLEL